MASKRPGLLAREWVAWFNVWWHCLWRLFKEPPHLMCALYAIDPKRTTHFCSCGYGNGGVTWEEFMKSREHLQYEAAGSKLIRVNGVEKRILPGILSYDDVVWLAGFPRGVSHLVVYSFPGGEFGVDEPCGKLTPGHSITALDGMVFTVQ